MEAAVPLDGKSVFITLSALDREQLCDFHGQRDKVLPSPAKDTPIREHIQAAARIYSTNDTVSRKPPVEADLTRESDLFPPKTDNKDNFSFGSTPR